MKLKTGKAALKGDDSPLTNPKPRSRQNAEEILATTR